jgi:hypothetical protein
LESLEQVPAASEELQIQEKLGLLPWLSRRARSDPSRIHWVWHYCHHHRFIGRGVFHTTSSISAAKRHLEEDKPGHNIFKPGTTQKAKLESTIYDVLMAGSKPVLQVVANKLSGFNIHRFQLAAVG